MLYNKIINDVKDGKNGNKFDENKIETLKKNLIKYMDDLMVRITYILNRKISQEYKQSLSGEESKEKEIYQKIGFYSDLPIFKIDFNTRVFLGEKIFEENNKNNFGYLILKTLAEDVPCEIKKKVGSNIVLSGGITMLDGFYQRFVDEVNYIANNNNEFMRLKGIKDDLRVHKIIYPRNILSWVGASLLIGVKKSDFPGNEINNDEELTKIIEQLKI